MSMARVGNQARRYRLAGHRQSKALQTPTAMTGETAAGPEVEQAENVSALPPAAALEPSAATADSKKEPSAWADFASRITTVSTLVTSLAAIAALLFTGLSLQQTRAQNQLAQSGQITDRFNAAVTNLGSDTETIRIGGIYALQRIMQDSPRDQPAVVQVLAAFVREQAPLKGAPGLPETQDPMFTPPPTPTAAPVSVSPVPQAISPAIDVQTALNVLAARNPADDDSASIDLEATDLSGATLSNANLAGANLTDANLTWASLTGANLTHANLDGANLTHAQLVDADLADAWLTGAVLAYAFLQSADLTHSMLSDADLTSGEFDGANLAGADLHLAILTNADLIGANLTGATFWLTSLCSGDTPNHPGGYSCTRK